jgi:hypothetical protein
MDACQDVIVVDVLEPTGAKPQFARRDTRDRYDC